MVKNHDYSCLRRGIFGLWAGDQFGIVETFAFQSGFQFGQVELLGIGNVESHHPAGDVGRN